MDEMEEGKQKFLEVVKGTDAACRWSCLSRRRIACF